MPRRKTSSQVDIVAISTIQAIIATLEGLNPDATAKDAASKGITRTIARAFRSIPKEKYKKFRDTLARKVHPDKLEHTNPALFRLFTEKKIDINLPSRIISDMNNGFQAQAECEQWLTSYSPLIRPLMPLIDHSVYKIENSYQPWQALILVFVLSSATVLFFPLCLIIVVDLVQALLLTVVRIAVNVITEDSYQRTIDSCLTDKAVSQFIKKEMPFNDHFTDEEVIKTYLHEVLEKMPEETETQETEDTRNQKLLADLRKKVGYAMRFEALAIMALAFQKAITKPLPGSFFEQCYSLLMRAIQVLTVLPSLALSAGFTLLLAAVRDILLPGYMFFLVVGVLAVAVLTSLPLYLIDSLSYPSIGGNVAPHDRPDSEHTGSAFAFFKSAISLGSSSKNTDLLMGSPEPIGSI